LRYAGVEPLPLTPSLRLGEHTAEILREWLGLDDEIDELAQEEVI
jgi:crotonobetainyl-CoA:carnitine CoA-transferase CaiB-like acyl-CoA transferase